ncbi:MAG: PAS domain S-box protein, partial [Thermoanaerobaculia bacterium]|nr:PAS domain S-box protein [Thermoanaerobaculia bacterium]
MRVMTVEGSRDDSSEPADCAEKLGSRERRFQRLIEGATDVFFVIDAQGTLRYRSEGGKRLTGWEEEEVRGKPVTTFVLPESLAAAREAIAETLRRPGETVRTDLRLRHKNGSVVELEVQGRNLLDDPDVAGIVVTAHDITERRRTEQALRESGQLLEAILDAMPVRVFWKDLDLTYLGCNASFARDAGFPDASSIVGKNDFQMTWRDQAELYRADDRGILASGLPRLLFEEPQTTPDGGRIELLTSKVPLRGPGGEVRGVLGTYMDITPLKLAQAALRASEIRYRRLFEAAKDGILILDSGTGRVVDVNPFLIELLGVSREQFLEKKVWELGFFGDRLANEANFAELRAKGYIRYDDMALRASDGRRVEVEFVSNVYEVNEIPVIQCNIRDISARKRAEEATTRLATAVEQSAEAVVITDVTGAILYANPAFEKVSGYTREEVAGRNPRILKSGKQDDACYRRMWEALANGEVWRGKLVNRRKDGTLFEEEATISPVRDSSGRVVNYVAAKRDVTNESRLRGQLFEAQKMETVGRLAGGVAHDFNNLLGVILGCGEILHGELGEGDPRREGVEEILKAAEHAASLTRQLLAFSRRQVLQTEILDLQTIVANLGRMLQRLVGEDRELSTRIAPDTGCVRAD